MAVELNILLFKFLLSRGHSGKFSRKQYKIHFSGDRLGEQNVLESLFFELSDSLKFKIFPPMGAMVQPPELPYKPLVLSYSGVGTYDSFKLNY